MQENKITPSARISPYFAFIVSSTRYYVAEVHLGYKAVSFFFTIIDTYFLHLPILLTKLTKQTLFEMTWADYF